jgi:hypothetical protein
MIFASILLLILRDNAQDEERAVCDCLNPFDVIAVALARHLFFGALLILGDVPEVRGDIGWDNRFEKAPAFSNPSSSHCYVFDL